MEEGIDDKIRALDICENGVTSKNKRNRLVFYVNTVLVSVLKIFLASFSSKYKKVCSFRSKITELNQNGI